MTPLLIGAALLFLVLGAMRILAQVDAQMLARNLRRGGGLSRLGRLNLPVEPAPRRGVRSGTGRC